MAFLNMNNDYMVNRLKELIQLRNLTQGYVAEKADISLVTLSRLLNKKLNLNNVDTLQKLARALNVPVGYFFGETDIDKKEEPLPAIMPTPVVHWGETPPETINKQNFVFIPVFESKAAATPAILDISHDHVEGWVCIPKINKTEDTWHAFKVRGDSMSPYLLENDLAIIQPYTLPPDFLQPDKIYLVHIVDENGNTGLMLKRAMIQDHYLFLSSINPEYSPLAIDMRTLNHNPIKGVLKRIWREA